MATGPGSYSRHKFLGEVLYPLIRDNGTAMSSEEQRQAILDNLLVGMPGDAAGDLSDGEVTPTGGSDTRTLGDWALALGEVTYLSPDMSEAELSAAITAGGNIRMQPGTYTFASGITVTNTDICIEGAGEKLTKIRFQGSGTFLTISQDSEGYRTTVKNLTLEPNRVAGPCARAIDITYPSVSSAIASVITLDHLDIPSNTSATTPFGITWTSCFKFTNCWRPRITNVNFSSSRNLGKTDGSSFIEFAGGQYASVAAVIENCVAYFPHYGILCSGYTEGVFFSNVEFVGVTVGISVPSSTALGGAANARRGDYFWLSNFHISAWTTAIDLDTVAHLKTVNLDIGANSSSTELAWKGIKLNACMNHEIEGRIAGSELAGSEGLTVTGGHNCSAILSFENLDSQFSFDVNHSYGHVIGLSSGAGANRDVYTNSSTTTLVEWMNVLGQKIISDDLVVAAIKPTAGLTVTAAGSGGFTVNTAGGTQFVVSDVSNAVASVLATGAATGNAPTIQPFGAATDINFGVNAKGAGVIIMGKQVVLVTGTPASAAASGIAGQVCWDADYIYVCTATNTWKRVAIATW